MAAGDDIWLPFQKQAPLAPIGATSDWAVTGGPSNRTLAQNGGYTQTPLSMLAMGGMRIRPEGGRPVTEVEPEVPSKEAVEGFGKTSIKIVPTAPVTPWDPDIEAPERPPGSEYGFAQNVARSLTDFATGFLPNDLQLHVENLAGLIGAGADLPLEALSHVPLPWQPDVAQSFAMLPETPQKSDAMIRMEGMDATEQHWYMSQYIRSHQGELAEAMHVPTLAAGFFMPDATLLERLFSLLGVGAKGVAGIVTDITNPDQSYMDKARDVSKMPPAQRQVYERYNAGAFGPPGSSEAIGRLRDELSIAGYSYTDDPFINMMLEMVGDPLIIGGFGTGIAKLMRGGALLRQAGDLVRVTRHHPNPVVREAYEAARLAESMAAAAPRGRIRKAMGSGETIEAKIANRLTNDARPEVQDAVRQARREYVNATKTNRGRLKAQADLMLTTPLGSRMIQGAARVSDIVNSPFGFFGRDGIGKAVSKALGIKDTQGFFAGYEMGRVYGLMSKVPEQYRGELEQNLGHAVAFARRAVHQSTLTKILRVTGLKQRADYMPDNITPAQVSKSMGDIDNPFASMQMEHHVREVKTQFGPEPGMDPAQYWKEVREQAAVKWAKATGMDIAEARAIFAKADVNELGFADAAYFGKLIREIVDKKKLDLADARAALEAARAAVRMAGPAQKEAAQKAFDEAAKRVSDITRYTVVGPRELTMARAEKALKAIGIADEEGAFAAAEALVAQYDLMRVNFWTKQADVDKKAFLKNMRIFLEDVIEKQSLVQTVGVASLPDNLRGLMTQVRKDLGPDVYEIGMAPAAERIWRVVTDEEGRAVGYVGWMDIDTAAQAMSMPTRFDVIRQQLLGVTRGETMAMEARRKFVRDAHAWGVSTQDARTLWSALRRKATEMEITIRGLDPAVFKQIIEEADIPAAMRTRLGYRELQIMAVRAMEGDLRHSGITSKATNRMKSATASWGPRGNYVGFIAENIYPKVRFHYNPMFWIQEWIEPLYLNILRGKKPRIKFDEKAVGQMSDLLDHLDLGTGLSEGIELRHSWVLGAVQTHMNAGPNTGVAGFVERLTRKATGIAQVKATNAEALTRDLLGQYFRETMDKIAPGQHAEIRAVMNQLDINRGGKGHLTDGEVAVRYLAQQGFYDPDGAHTHIQLYDGAKPKDLGRIESVRKSYLARAIRGPNGETYASGSDLQAAIRAGEIDEWDARSQMAVMGYDPDYISRSWAVLRGVDVVEFLDGIETDYAKFMPPAEARQARELMQALLEVNAVRKGMDTEEYVATKFADNGRYLDAAGRLPYNAYTQLTDRLIEEAGLKVFDEAAPEVINLRARAKTMLPTEPHKDVGDHIKQLEKTADAHAKGKSRPAPKKRLKKRMHLGRFIAYGDVNLAEWKEMTIAAMDEESISGAGMWYRSMVPKFASVADGIDEVTLRNLAEVMNKKMPSLHPIDLADDLPGLRAEVGARMLMSFGASQINMSPMRGFSFVLRSIDQMSRGERTGVLKTGGFKIAQGPVIRLLNDFEANITAHGFGPKLHDFVDSLLGNTERSFMRFNPDQRMMTMADGTTMVRQPAAMDVWSGREMGFVDSGLISHFARKLSRDEGYAFNNNDVANSPAVVEAQLRMGFFYKKSTIKILEDGTEKKVDESMDAYHARKAAFEKEHGVELEDAWSGSPSFEEYEWMLTRYNEMAHELNKTGWLSRSYENDPWTVADIQAIGWVRIQKALDIDPGGPVNMFSQNAAQVAFEIVPGDHTPLGRALPLHLATDDAKDIVTRDVSMALAKVISERTGVTIVRSMPGYRGYQKQGAKHLSPNTFWEVLGSDGQIKDAIDMLSYLTQQDRIRATRRPQKGGGGEMPTTNSKTRHWGIDFQPQMPEGVPQMYVLDALREYLDTHGMEWPGSMNGATENGDMVVRTLYEDMPVGADIDEFTRTRGVGKRPTGVIDGVLHLDSRGDTAFMDAVDSMTAPQFDDFMETGLAKAGPEKAGLIEEHAGTFQPGHRMFIRYDDAGNPVAFVEFSVNDDGGVRFIEAVTREDARRQGHMTALYDHIQRAGYDIAAESGTTVTQQGRAFSQAWRAKQPPPMSDLEKALADGSWAVEMGFEGPLPVTTTRDLHVSIDRTHDWAADEARVEARVAKGEDRATVHREEMGRRILEDLRYEGVEGIPDRTVIDPTTVPLGTTPIPPGMVRVYHYTGAPEEVLSKGLLRSAAKGETYGEPNVIWASAEQFKPGVNGKAVVELHLYPHELAIGRSSRMATQEGIDSFNAGTSNVTLNLEEIPPSRFVAFATPETGGYQYFLKTYGRNPTPEVVERVRGMLTSTTASLRAADPRFAGYQRWLDEYDAGTLANEPTPTVIKGVKTRAGRNRGSIADSLVDRDMGAIRGVWDRSFKEADPDAWAKGAGDRHLQGFDESTDYTPYEQSSPRGWRGATAYDTLGRATLFTNQHADLTTLVHESFHFWASELDPSGVEAIHKAWIKANKIKKADRPTSHDRLKREAEEWAGVQFEKYVAEGFSGVDLPSEVHAIFNAYGDWGRAAGALPNVQMDPRLRDLFGKMSPDYHRGPMATFDVNQFRFMEAARISLQRAYEEAFAVHYFKRGRTWLERSLNHPYLGMYPASYMWGKVLPELLRFLVKKPFGVDAPFAGMAMANHVWEAVQIELSSDSDFAQLLQDNPEALRFISLLIPGTPWDIPVNIPAWLRRVVKADMRNEDMDVGGALTDTLVYAFGAGRGPFDLLQSAGQTAKFGAGLAGIAAGNDYTSKAEAEAEVLTRPRMQRPGEPPPPPRTP